MKISNDKTLIKERLERYRKLIVEYEQIKKGTHGEFKFVQQWALARKLNKKIFLKYYNRYRNTPQSESLLPNRRGPKIKSVLSEEQTNAYRQSIFSVLHSPPNSFGYNRTSWRIIDLLETLELTGVTISKSMLRRIMKSEGYKFKKARKVLTSNDPKYRQKIDEIKMILSKLVGNEKFFSVDEFGPVAVKIQPGRLWLLPDERNYTPQNQKGKGSLIVTAALELSTNQVVHFFSDKKNTGEIIRLINLLVLNYSEEENIYFSWDVASWHNSKKLNEKVKEHNSLIRNPKIKIVPLPANSQFLNVIESVFSGLAKSVIHNSNYASVEECKRSIDLYFEKRNEFYKLNPKKAGKKIWGEELTEPKFDESNNCKNKNYMR